MSRPQTRRWSRQPTPPSHDRDHDQLAAAGIILALIVAAVIWLLARYAPAMLLDVTP